MRGKAWQRHGTRAETTLSASQAAHIHVREASLTLRVGAHPSSSGPRSVPKEWKPSEFDASSRGAYGVGGGRRPIVTSRYWWLPPPRFSR